MSTYSFTVKVATQEYATYKAELASDTDYPYNSLLYAAKDSKDKAYIKVSGVDTSNNSIELFGDDFSITLDSGFTSATESIGGNDVHYISGDNSKVSAAGTATATIWVSGKSVATVDIPYDVAASAPAAAYTKTTKSGVSTWKSGTATITKITGVSAEDGVLTLDGQTSAQVMLLCGTGENGLWHPYWRENLKLALYLQNAATERWPSLTRPIELVKERYNQQLCTGMLILEVGSTGNTLREAVAAAESFGDAAGAALAKLVV